MSPLDQHLCPGGWRRRGFEAGEASVWEGRERLQSGCRGRGTCTSACRPNSHASGDISPHCPPPHLLPACAPPWALHPLPGQTWVWQRPRPRLPSSWAPRTAGLQRWEGSFVFPAGTQGHRQGDGNGVDLGGKKSEGGTPVRTRVMGEETGDSVLCEGSLGLCPPACLQPLSPSPEAALPAALWSRDRSGIAPLCDFSMFHSYIKK